MNEEGGKRNKEERRKKKKKKKKILLRFSPPLRKFKLPNADDMTANPPILQALLQNHLATSDSE